MHGALTEVSPRVAALEGYAGFAQSRRAASRHKQQLDDRLPESFAELLDPVFTGDAAVQRWDPGVRRWA